MHNNLSIIIIIICFLFYQTKLNIDLKTKLRCQTQGRLGTKKFSESDAIKQKEY